MSLQIAATDVVAYALNFDCLPNLEANFINAII